MVSTAREYHAPIGHQHFRWHISFLTQHFHDGLPIGKLSGNMLLEQIEKSNIVSHIMLYSIEKRKDVSMTVRCECE